MDGTDLNLDTHMSVCPQKLICAQLHEYFILQFTWLWASDCYRSSLTAKLVDTRANWLDGMKKCGQILYGEKKAEHDVIKQLHSHSFSESESVIRSIDILVTCVISFRAYEVYNSKDGDEQNDNTEQPKCMYSYVCLQVAGNKKLIEVRWGWTGKENSKEFVKRKIQQRTQISLCPGEKIQTASQTYQ